MAKYLMVEMTDLNNSGKRRMYPKIDLEGLLSTEMVASQISKGTTYTVADVKGVLAALAQNIAQNVADGYSVKIEGIGVFSASLRVKKGREPEYVDASKRLNAQSIAIRNINFRADRQLVRNVGMAFSPVRSEKVSQRSSSTYSKDERLAIVLDFLTSHPMITVSDYCRLVGLLRTSAAIELKLWAADPSVALQAVGKKSHKVYISAPVLQNDDH